ncbi:Uncharacterised protein [Enterobacter cloacae]|nr:Uncharacterised protein [Enterobacter cloacae]
MAAVALATSSARCDMVFLIMSVQREAYLALFFVSSFTR